MEKHDFVVDQSMVFDLIEKQAAGLDRALLELVMNAVDADATRVEVSLANDRMSVYDDGRGFRTREEVQNNFQRFGRRHDPDEAKTFGTFRMGRGQAMAFGRAAWRSRSFRMAVDVRADRSSGRAGFVLEDGLADEPGCRVTVEFYPDRRLSHSGLLEARLALRRAVKWLALPVLLDGEQVSADPAGHPGWTVDDDHWYFRLDLDRACGLEVYNMGVFVRTLPHGYHDFGGEFVSCVPLQLNIPRNDVMPADPVWQDFLDRAGELARAERERLDRLTRKGTKPAGKKNAGPKKEYLSVGERWELLGGLVSSGREATRKECGLPLLLTHDGRWVSARYVARQAEKSGRRLSFSSRKDEYSAVARAAADRMTFRLSAALPVSLADALPAPAEGEDGLHDRDRVGRALVRAFRSGLAGCAYASEADLDTLLETIALEKDRRVLSPAEAALLDAFDSELPALRSRLAGCDLTGGERGRLMEFRLGLGYTGAEALGRPGPGGLFVLSQALTGKYRLGQVADWLELAVRLTRALCAHVAGGSAAREGELLAAAWGALPGLVTGPADDLCRQTRADLADLAREAAQARDRLAHLEATSADWSGLGAELARLQARVADLRRKYDPDHGRDAEPGRVLTLSGVE